MVDRSKSNPELDKKKLYERSFGFWRQHLKSLEGYVEPETTSSIYGLSSGGGNPLALHLADILSNTGYHVLYSDVVIVDGQILNIDLKKRKIKGNVLSIRDGKLDPGDYVFAEIISKMMKKEESEIVGFKHIVTKPFYKEYDLHELVPSAKKD